MPVILGFILFVLYQERLVSTILRFVGASRERLRGVRHFECAAYPRLVISGRYDIKVWYFIVAFLILELDFLFFLGELCTYEV